MYSRNLKIQNGSGWCVITKPNPAASHRIFCFPYAGGGTNVFRNWHNLLSENVEVVTIQLPGRERRFAEQPISDLKQLVLQLKTEFIRLMNKPYFVFGHSNGCLIIYELLKQLTVSGIPLPQKTLLSSKSPPHLKDTEDIKWNLPDHEFLKELKDMQGTPKEVLENEELMSLFLPTIRADFALGDTYEFVSVPKINNNIHLIRGDADSVSQEELQAWQELFFGTVEYDEVAGGHFHVIDDAAQITAKVNQSISSLI